MYQQYKQNNLEGRTGGVEGTVHEPNKERNFHT